MKKVDSLFRKSPYTLLFLLSCVIVGVYLLWLKKDYVFEGQLSFELSKPYEISLSFTNTPKFEEDDAFALGEGDYALASTGDKAEGALEGDYQGDNLTNDGEGVSTSDNIGEGDRPGGDGQADNTGLGDDGVAPKNESNDALNASESEEAMGEDAEDSLIGETLFEYYEPVETNSIYYTDPGRIALTTQYPYSEVTDEYFDDAAWIGDSRVLGLSDYSGWTNTDFYCDNGYCVYKWTKNNPVVFQNTHSKVLLEDAFSSKQYGKIYIMIGLNDCGYGNTQDFKERYISLLEMLEEKQPDAIIYLVANLHMSTKMDSEPVLNNIDVNDKNVAIAECADGERRFYLDYNEIFTDETGHLLDELTFDGVHMYAQAYEAWTDYFRKHAVVR